MSWLSGHKAASHNIGSLVTSSRSKNCFRSKLQQPSSWELLGFLQNENKASEYDCNSFVLGRLSTYKIESSHCIIEVQIRQHHELERPFDNMFNSVNMQPLNDCILYFSVTQIHKYRRRRCRQSPNTKTLELIHSIE
jgi:hypothetical protein